MRPPRVLCIHTWQHLSIRGLLPPSQLDPNPPFSALSPTSESLTHQPFCLLKMPGFPGSTMPPYPKELPLSLALPPISWSPTLS